MVYTPCFFLFKMHLFHNSNLFGSCIIHILYTECAKIKKIIPAPKGYYIIPSSTLTDRWKYQVLSRIPDMCAHIIFMYRLWQAYVTVNSCGHFDIITLKTGLLNCLNARSRGLTLRHRASCTEGQAFHYSPQNAFYIFNQQIYFIIWYLLDRASLI